VLVSEPKDYQKHTAIHDLNKDLLVREKGYMMLFAADFIIYIGSTMCQLHGVLFQPSSECDCMCQVVILLQIKMKNIPWIHSHKTASSFPLFVVVWGFSGL